MYNEILKIGPFTIHGYGLMIGIGVIFALIMADTRARKKDFDVDFVYNVSFIALLFGFIGAKLLYCIVEIEEVIRNPLEIFSGSGFVVYGGIIGGILAAGIYCKKKKVNFLRFFDFAVPSVAVAQGFGRIGCFLAGCCYGRETNAPIGIAFRASTMAPNGIALIPTQLFSSTGDFLLALILIVYARKDRKAGKVSGLYLMLYSLGRFIIEFFRADERGHVGSLSTSQFIALLLLLLGLLLFFKSQLSFFNREK